MEIVGGGISLPEKNLACRVAGGFSQPQAPSEPCVSVSPHTAQASEGVSRVGIPASPEAYFMVLPDCQNSLWDGERTIQNHHLCFPISADVTSVSLSREYDDLFSLIYYS